jgi:hypothetical protein
MEQDPFLALDAFFPKASQGKSGRAGNGFQLGSDDDGEASDVGVIGARKKVSVGLRTGPGPGKSG